MSTSQAQLSALHAALGEPSAAGDALISYVSTLQEEHTRFSDRIRVLESNGAGLTRTQRLVVDAVMSASRDLQGVEVCLSNDFANNGTFDETFDDQALPFSLLGDNFALIDAAGFSVCLPGGSRTSFVWRLKPFEHWPGLDKLEYILQRGPTGEASVPYQEDIVLEADGTAPDQWPELPSYVTVHTERADQCCILDMSDPVCPQFKIDIAAYERVVQQAAQAVFVGPLAVVLDCLPDAPPQDFSDAPPGDLF